MDGNLQKNGFNLATEYARVPKEWACKQCGKMFWQMSTCTGRPRAFCSIACKVENARIRAASRYDALKPINLCTFCGNILDGHAGRKLCSICSQKRRSGTLIVVCSDCRNPFNTGSTKAKRCRACALVAENLRRSQICRATARSKLASGKLQAPSANVGTQGELLFELLCVRHGITVARSAIEQQPNWDRLVLLKERTVRVSVKALRAERFGNRKRWRWKSREALALSAAVDVVAIVDVTSATVVIIPSRVAELTNYVNLQTWEHATMNALWDTASEKLTSALEAR